MLTGGTVLAAFVALPRLHRLVLASFLVGEFETEPIRWLSAINGAFMVFCLLPHTAGSGQGDKKRKAQELFGESGQKMAKLSTTFSTAQHLNSLKVVLGFLANVKCLVVALTGANEDILAIRGKGRRQLLLADMAEQISLLSAPA